MCQLPEYYISGVSVSEIPIIYMIILSRSRSVLDADASGKVATSSRSQRSLVVKALIACSFCDIFYVPNMSRTSP